MAIISPRAPLSTLLFFAMKKETDEWTCVLSRILLLACDLLRSHQMSRAGFMSTSIFADVTLIRGETALMVYFMLLHDHNQKLICMLFYTRRLCFYFHVPSISRSRGSNSMIITYKEMNFRASDKKADYFDESRE